MQLTSKRIIPAEHRDIAEKVKRGIQSVDPSAIVILFGSRARGDAEEESDWDFLVLSDVQDVEELGWTLRKHMRVNIEMEFDVAISLMIRNKTMWREDYPLSSIYDSISEEGIVV